ncbi:SUKH-4 family immunity protein [Streptomyces thermolineatus]
MRAEVTAGRMEHWFGADGVTRLPAHLLPPTDLLPHGPSRRFLTAIGLPADRADLELSLHHDDALPPVTGGLPNTAPGARRLLVLGEPAYHGSHAVLDGETGRLEVPADSFDGESYDGTPLDPYLNRDLSALLCTCWILQRLQEEWERWDYGRAGETWRAFDVHSLLLSRMEDLMDHVDPHALEHPGGPWRTTVDDPYTGGPLG